MLEVDSQETRSFNHDDVNFLQSYANLMAAAIDRLKSHRELTELVKQRNILLRELQHRVKNTLQIICAFVALERKKNGNEESLGAPVASISSRVHALSALYDRLLPTDGQRVVDFCDYVEEICKGLVLIPEGKTIYLEMHCTSLLLDVEQAFPLGLITNEFISNSIKHAFPDGRGQFCDVGADGRRKYKAGFQR